MASKGGDQQNLASDIAVIKSQLLNLSDNFEEYKNDNKRFCESISTRIGTIETRQASVGTKVSNLAIFQSVFSVIIGGIATYLGSKK